MELNQERLERYANVANNEWKALVMLFSRPDRYEDCRRIRERIRDFRRRAPSRSITLKHLRYLTSKEFISEENGKFKATKEGQEIGKPLALRSLEAADLSGIGPKNALGPSNSPTQFTAPALRCLVLDHLSDQNEWQVSQLAREISQAVQRDFKQVRNCLLANILFKMKKNGLIEYIADLPSYQGGPLSWQDSFSYFRLIEEKEFPVFVDSDGYPEPKTTQKVAKIFKENLGKWLSVGEISKLAGLKGRLSEALYFFHRKGCLEHKSGRPRIRITERGLIWAEKVASPIVRKVRNPMYSIL